MLRSLVLLAAAWAVIGLFGAHRLSRAYGRRTLHARPAGNPAAGVRYAFTWAMVPWAKESVTLNPFSYGAGILFHLGVFTALALLAGNLAGLEPEGALRLAGAVLTGLGAACGLALLVKRLARPQLRGLSTPDDFLANLLTTLFSALAFGRLRSAGLDPLWLAEAALLLAYVPVGKIRHCLFFFPTRRHLGAFFGRRGTFPPGGDLHA